MTAIELSFDATANSADAIQRAAYKFCDRFTLDLRRDADRFRCTLEFPGDAEPDPATAADFRTEVLDQVLRGRIRQETEAARNLMLALAFSKADLDTD